MPEKYFATILRKKQITQNDYIYLVDKIVAGDIEEESQTFVTTAKEKYQPFKNFSEPLEENYYLNIAKTDNIESYFGESVTFDEAYKKYEQRCREFVYYLGKTNDSYITVPIDKGKYVRVIDAIIEDESKFESNERISFREKEQVSGIGSEKEESEDGIIEVIKELVMNVISGNFTPDELIDIKARLIAEKEEIEAAIMSVEVQQETLETELDNFIGHKQESISIPKPTPLSTHAPIDKSIDINDIFSKVTKTLVAQDEPARRMIVELTRLNDMRRKDYAILLTGESGVGKTLLMSLLARYIDRPLLQIDSTQLTASGFVGKDIEQYLWDLYEDCNKDLQKAEHAIIYFDEIDKKGSSKKSDPSGQGVLNMLLKFLDGTTYEACKNPQMQRDDNTVKMNTKDMIVVAGGAFLEVYQSSKNKQIGFNQNRTLPIEQPEEPEIKDFITKAMMPKEFMGRVPVIIRLNNLDIDGIRGILLESDDSALKLQEEVFAKRGVKLTTKDGYILEVSQQALDRKIGARGINKIISDSTWEAYYDVCSNPETYEEIILTQETITNPKKYEKVKKSQNK